MTFLAALKALIEGLVTSAKQEKPIGLKTVSELMNYSNDELLNQLAQPIASSQKFKLEIRSKNLHKTAPAFVHLPKPGYARFDATQRTFISKP